MIIFGIIFYFTRKPFYMLFSQGISSFAIMTGFMLMNCSMSAYIWGYFSIVVVGMIVLALMMIIFDKHIQNQVIRDYKINDWLNHKMGLNIQLIDSQKLKIFTHKRQIYVSVGVLELLSQEELNAVIAHERFHVDYTPNRIVLNTLALSSFWFKGYRDEQEADKYAANDAGLMNLVNAFEKLGVRNYEKRVNNLLISSPA